MITITHQHNSLHKGATRWNLSQYNSQLTPWSKFQYSKATILRKKEK